MHYLHFIIADFFKTKILKNIVIILNLFSTFDAVIGTGNNFQGQFNPKVGNLLKSN